MTNEQSLCEWCGKPLTSDVIMRIGDDDICPECYWRYRKDKYLVKRIRNTEVTSNGT